MFIKRGETNCKYILILVILAAIVGGGILTYQYWWLPKEEIEIPEVKIPEEVTKDETANWKTYRNERYKYEVKYPSDGNFREIPSSAYHDPNKGYSTVDFEIKDLLVRISSWRNDENYITLDKLIEGEIQKQKKGIFSVFPTIPPLGFYQKIQVGGLPALKWFTYHETEGRIAVQTIAFDEKDYYYHLSGVKPSGYYLPDRFGEEQDKIYDLFLSTFQFLE